MIVRFNPRPEDLQHLQVGPLGPHLPSFATLVSQQGYCSGTGWLKVRFVAKLSRWLPRPTRRCCAFAACADLAFDHERRPCGQ